MNDPPRLTHQHSVAVYVSASCFLWVFVAFSKHYQWITILSLWGRVYHFPLHFLWSERLANPFHHHWLALLIVCHAVHYHSTLAWHAHTTSCHQHHCRHHCAVKFSCLEQWFYLNWFAVTLLTLCLADQRSVVWSFVLPHHSQLSHLRKSQQRVSPTALWSSFWE